MSKGELNLLNIFWIKIKKKTIQYEGNNVGDIISQFIKEHKEELDSRSAPRTFLKILWFPGYLKHNP